MILPSVLYGLIGGVFAFREWHHLPRSLWSVGAVWILWLPLIVVWGLGELWDRTRG